MTPEEQADGFSAGLGLDQAGLDLLQLTLEQVWETRARLAVEFWGERPEILVPELKQNIQELEGLIRVWEGREEYERCAVGKSLQKRLRADLRKLEKGFK